MTSPSHSAPGVYSRIGVIGDIHTAVDRLSWALEVLRGQGVELVCATGDIVDGPYNGSAVVRACELLQEARALTVLGNHDRWLLDRENRSVEGATFPEDIDRATRSYLQLLPASAELHTPAGLMLLGHGLGSDDMCSLFPYDHGPALRNNDMLQRLIAHNRYRYVVSGHTHARMVRMLGPITFINAGAIQETREPCCLVLDFARESAQFFDWQTGGGTTLGPSFTLSQAAEIESVPAPAIGRRSSSDGI
ncbi:MAG: metallophosphoesterase family protein [Polyangiales bacterium]